MICYIYIWHFLSLYSEIGLIKYYLSLEKIQDVVRKQNRIIIVRSSYYLLNSIHTQCHAYIHIAAHHLCPEPPRIDNGTVSVTPNGRVYVLLPIGENAYRKDSTAKYTCMNDLFDLVGDPLLTCSSNGNWDLSPPRCSKYI